MTKQTFSEVCTTTLQDDSVKTEAIYQLIVKVCRMKAVREKTDAILVLISVLEQKKQISDMNSANEKKIRACLKPLLPSIARRQPSLLKYLSSTASDTEHSDTEVKFLAQKLLVIIGLKCNARTKLARENVSALISVFVFYLKHINQIKAAEITEKDLENFCLILEKALRKKKKKVIQELEELFSLFQKIHGREGGNLDTFRRFGVVLIHYIREFKSDLMLHKEDMEQLKQRLPEVNDIPTDDNSHLGRICLTHLAVEEAVLRRARACLEHYEKDIGGIQSVLEAIALYRQFAMEGNENAIAALIEMLSDAKNKEDKWGRLPEIFETLACIFAQEDIDIQLCIAYTKSFKASTGIKITSEKDKQRSVEHLLKKANKRFISLISERGDAKKEENVYFRAADFFYRQKHFVQAREWYEYYLSKENERDRNDYFNLASMYFHGQGGEFVVPTPPVDHSALSNKIDDVSKVDKAFARVRWDTPQAQYFQFERYYYLYLLHRYKMKDKPGGKQQLQRCIDTLEAITDSQLLSKVVAVLYMMYRHDDAYLNEEDKTRIIARLYEVYSDDAVDSLPVLCDLPDGLSQQEYADYFYQRLPTKAEAAPSSSISTYSKKIQQARERLETFVDQERLSDELLNVEQDVQLVLSDTKQAHVPLVRAVHKRLAFHALKNGETLLLRQYADRYQLSPEDEDYQQVKGTLQAFYEQHPEGMFSRLATIYLYEKARHPCGYGQVAIIKEILDSLDVQEDAMEATLQTREATARTFFDECLSDDSDAERNERFKRGEGSIHADWKTRANLFEIINPTLGTLLIKALTYQPKIEPAEERKQFKTFMSSVQTSLVKSHAKASLYQKQPRFDDSVWRDLRTLNHYHAQGKLAEGLKRIEGRFYVALLRGLHFDFSVWNQSQRREIPNNIYDASHPFRGKPIYSRAVYQLADITTYANVNDAVTQTRLQLFAHFLQTEMQPLQGQKSFTSEQLNQKNSRGEVLPDEVVHAMLGRTFSSKAHQLQQLYSNSYDKVHLFFSWATGIKDKTSFPFYSPYNPFVSMAELESGHASRYAFGIKDYSDLAHRHRLRPKYNREQRALRPKSGYVTLSFHPLTDFSSGTTLHVPSMDIQGCISVDPRIVPERETTRAVSTPPDRLKYVELAKYPSFHHDKFLDIFALRYGLKEDDYKLFQRLFRESKPHTPERQVAKYLLGAYLAAYQSIYLLDKAKNWANRHGITLLFRDEQGNFSLRPTATIREDANADAWGDQFRRLARHTLFFKREGSHQTSLRKRKKQRVSPSAQEIAGDRMCLDEGDEKESVVLKASLAGKERLATIEAKRGSKFEDATRKAALRSQRAISQVMVDGCASSSITVEIIPNGDCGFTATERALRIQGRDDMAVAVTRQGFINSVKDIILELRSTSRPTTRSKKLTQLVKAVYEHGNIMYNESRKQLSQWKAHFNRSGEWANDVHFALMSYVCHLRFEFYVLDHKNNHQFVPRGGSLCDASTMDQTTDQTQATTIRLLCNSSGLVNMAAADPNNHFDLLYFNPNEALKNRIKRLRYTITQDKMLTQRTSLSVTEEKKARKEDISQSTISPQEKFLQAIRQCITPEYRDKLVEVLHQFEEIYQAAITVDNSKTFRDLLSNVQEKFTQYNQQYPRFLQKISMFTKVLTVGQRAGGGSLKNKINILKTLIKPYGEYKLAEQLTQEGKMMGKAIDNGDCFFDAIAQGLQQLGRTNDNGQYYTAKELRLLCASYANRLPTPDWLENAVKKYHKEVDWETYKAKIGLMSDEHEPPIWGDIEAEGEIFIRHFNIQLRQVDTDERIAFNIQDRMYFMENGSLTFEIYSQAKHLAKEIIEIAVYRRHAVPVIPERSGTMRAIANDNQSERQEQRVSPTLAAITRAQAERRALGSEESTCGQSVTSSSGEADDMDLSLDACNNN